MPLERLTITVEHTGASVAVRYNPEEYTLGKDNNFALQAVPGLGSPVVQFVHGNQQTLDVELFFDTFDTPDLPKYDVRDQTRRVARLMDLDSDLHAPPVLVVAMASLRLRCVLARVSQKFLMFMPDGVPVRARLTCSFIEVTDAAQEARRANLQTADFTKAHVVAPGETLAGIAAQRYDDPRVWRPIALANGLADPRAITVGQTLVVPALPYTHPRTGEPVR